MSVRPVGDLGHRQPTSKQRAAVFLKAAFLALSDAGGSLGLKDLKEEIARRVELSPHDLEIYEKTGYVRWESVLHFYSIDCVKAGFLKKQAGRWYLTPEGAQVRDLPGPEILSRAMRGYREWKAAQVTTPASRSPDEPVPDLTLDAVDRSLVFERAEAEARSEIEQYVRALGPYEFQELVAALLRGMGYTTPFIAPTGPDGGTDILAYPDPLGARTPHIRVQVKQSSEPESDARGDRRAPWHSPTRPRDRSVRLLGGLHQ
jgi:restriction system protein